MRFMNSIQLATLFSGLLMVFGAPSYSTGNQASPDSNYEGYGSRNSERYSENKSNGGYGGYGGYGKNYRKRPSRHSMNQDSSYGNKSGGSPGYDTQPKTTIQSQSYGQAPSTPNKGGFDIQLMLQLVNAERAKRGASPLKLNQKLVSAAQAHSDDQARTRNMSHSGSNGSSPSSRCKKAGYGSSTIGENVAWNQRDVNAVMKTWVASPGHYANIINKSYKEFGAGMNTLYWTQVFGGGESGSSNGNGGSYGSGKMGSGYY